MSDFEYDLKDPSLDEFDPARRRKWAYDPARRKRKGRMPAGLRRYWAARRARKADPARHHRGRHRRHDPARRRGSWRMFRRRRHDPGFGSAGTWTRSSTDYLGVAAGSIIHNFLVHTQGILAKTYNLGPFNVTQLGGLAGLLGIVGEHQRFIEPNGIVSDILKGIFAEGLNAPSVESIQRSGAGGAGRGMGGGLIADGSGGGLLAGGSFPSGATQSPLGIGPAGYIPPWAYT
jgi:hypothetical protein